MWKPKHADASKMIARKHANRNTYENQV